MSTPTFSFNVARFLLGAVCVIASTSCGGELLRTGRSPVYLVVTQISAEKGGTGSSVAFLISDVSLDDGSVQNDNVTVTLRVDLKNPTVVATAMNAVTLTRYHVNYRRTDGRNTPGTDVPYGFDGALTGTISAGLGTGAAIFEVVRHQAKLEPPLKNLAGFNDAGARSISGLGFLSTIAEITIWGRDQNGNEVIANTSIDVHFANFADTP